MRVIHLCFQLHEPFAVQKFEDGKPYFESKAAFEELDREVYQPFFALIERNTQKNKNFRVSLVVSGLWIELAERYDAELIRRLKKLVSLGQVELVAEPYYHSLAFFYDKNELSSQIKQYQSKVQGLFGAKTQILAMPEFIYNDGLAKWAEGAGFAGMLAGNSRRALGWHSANRVYEAVDCEYLRVLFCNTKLSDLIMTASPEILAEQVVDKEKQTKKMMMSVVKFQKKLDLEFLRGGLVNLYLDAGCIGRLRAAGVVAFFDELFESWLDVPKNKFATASMACVVETPEAELVVPEAISWQDVGECEDEPKVATQDAAMSLVVTPGLRLPDGLSAEEQLAFARELYGLRREILASEDEKLVGDYRHLLSVDYQRDLTKDTLDNYREILRDLKTRAEVIKKQQAVEISRTFTKRRDRGDVERVRPAVQTNEIENGTADSAGDDTVVIHFGGKRQTGPSSSAVHEAPDGSAHEGAVEVHRLPSMGQLRKSPVAEPMTKADSRAMVKTAHMIAVSDGEDDGEVVEERGMDDVDEMMGWAGAKEGETVGEQKKGIKHSIRRVIKKLVIE